MENNKSVKFVLKTLSLILFPVILLLLKPENAYGQSYDVYHHMILTAEDYYFLENNVDSSLFYYKKCFKAFDFVFARDAVNAFQIAYKEELPIEHFLKTAIESGVTPAVLVNIPALSDFLKDSLPQLEVMGDNDIYRARYLDRINIDCLNRTYRLGIIEQINKTKRTETMALFKMSMEYGLPGEKNCGIEELGIYKEPGSGAEDFLHLRDSISEKYGASIRYYSLDNNSLNMHIPIVIMLHDYCTYKYYEKDLHKAYLGGFIHPREIGLIYDNAFRGDGSHCLMVPNKGVFGLSAFEKQRNLNEEKANILRAKWEICSVETDKKKKEMQKLGYRFIWDY